MSATYEGLKDGRAIDQITERADQWAQNYRKPKAEESVWKPAYHERFDDIVDDLALRCTAPARAFGWRDWLLGVTIWFSIAAVVWIGSVVAMRPDTFGSIIFIIAAVLIALIGFGLSYRETTSKRQYQVRLAQKRKLLHSQGIKTVRTRFALRS